MLIVAKEGKANFRTIQQALDAVPSNSKMKSVIKIKNGIYREVITVDATKNNVSNPKTIYDQITATEDVFTLMPATYATLNIVKIA